MKAFITTFVLMLTLTIAPQFIISFYFKQNLDWFTGTHFWFVAFVLSLVLTLVATWLRKHGWW